MRIEAVKIERLLLAVERYTILQADKQCKNTALKESVDDRDRVVRSQVYGDGVAGEMRGGLGDIGNSSV